MEVNKMGIGKTVGYVLLIGAGFVGGMAYTSHHQSSQQAKMQYQMVVKDDTQFVLDKKADREVETGKLFKLYYAVEDVFTDAQTSGKSSALEVLLK
jgi:hypothetical protein